MVASYGGHQNRKNDPPPGPQIMRVGFQKLHERVHGFMLRAKSDLLLQEIQSTATAKFNQNNLLLERNLTLIGRSDVGIGIGIEKQNTI